MGLYCWIVMRKIHPRGLVADWLRQTSVGTAIRTSMLNGQKRTLRDNGLRISPRFNGIAKSCEKFYQRRIRMIVGLLTVHCRLLSLSGHLSAVNYFASYQIAKNVDPLENLFTISPRFDGRVFQDRLLRKSTS